MAALEFFQAGDALEPLSDRYATFWAKIVALKTAWSAGKVQNVTGDEQLAVRAGSALEAGDGAALQPLTQLVDALCGVGAHGLTKSAVLQVEAAELIVGETVRVRKGAECHGAMT